MNIFFHILIKSVMSLIVEVIHQIVVISWPHLLLLLRGFLDVPLLGVFSTRLICGEISSHKGAEEVNLRYIKSQKLDKLPPVKPWRFIHAAICLCLKVDELFPSEQDKFEKKNAKDQVCVA